MTQFLQKEGAGPELPLVFLYTARLPSPGCACGHPGYDFPHV